MKTIDKLAEALRDILDVTAQCDGYEVCQQDDFSEAREALATYEDEKQGYMPPDGHAGQMEDLGLRKRVAGPEVVMDKWKPM